MFREAVTSKPYNLNRKAAGEESLRKHRRLFEFSEDSRVEDYSEGSERSICKSDLPAKTKAKK